MESVLDISPTDLKRDPRVYRQLKCLVSRYSVTALGLASPQIDNLKFIHIQTLVSQRLEQILLNRIIR